MNRDLIHSNQFESLEYISDFFSQEESNYFFLKLENEIFWKRDELILFGKKIITKRKVAWYGSKEFEYNYSNSSKKAILWTENLIHLKNKIEEFSNEKFNSCLLNFYHSGEEGMGWHSDDEESIEKNSCIASISFGAERKFKFSHKSLPKKISILLENGSLLLMKGEIQTNWKHSIPIQKKVKFPRINLTFRKMRD